MSFRTQHCIRRLRLVAIVCLFTGCWQEIEYREDEPVADAAPAEVTQVDSTTTAADQGVANAPNHEPPPADSKEAIPSRENVVESTGVGDRYAGTEETASVEPPRETPAAESASPEPEAHTVSATVERAAPAETVSTRRAAWLLGSRLGLAALAHDRNVAPEETVVWFDEARTMAERLNTKVNDLPSRPATAGDEPASGEVRRYLLGDGRRIAADLATKYALDHALLFEVALKSDMLLVFNQQGSQDVSDIAAAIERAAPQAKLSEELWRPLLDTLAKQSPPVAVRAAVREMHANIDRYLAAETEQ
jgi:hypothetical protein